MKLSHFWAAVDSLGKTEAQRADALDLSERGFRDWRNKDVPRLIRRIVENPALAEALAKDAEEQAQKAS